MVDYITINSQGIPAIYPDALFQDEKYINRYINADGLHIAEKIFTEEKFGLSTQGTNKTSDNQLIQTLVYQKYKFFILASEYESIELIEIAQTLTITKQDESIVNGKIIEIERESLDDTENLIYRISFYDLDEDSKSINNYLIKENLLSSGLNYGKYSKTELNRLAFTGNKSVFTSYISLLTWDTTSGPHSYNFTIPVNDYTSGLAVSDVVNITSEHADNNYLQGVGVVEDITSTIITIGLPVTAQDGFTASNFQITWTKGNAINFIFYSLLSVLFQSPDIKFNDEKTNRGLTTFSESNILKIVTLRLYLTASERDMLNYIYYCEPQNILISDKNGSEIFRASSITDIIEHTNNKNLTDIFEVNINMQYNLQTFNPHS